MAQGCGFGLRLKPYLAGGVGVLVDATGDDRYKCGVFGQGVSYWFALGMLVDLAGNDTYEGVYYCQGTSAHSGVGALCDLDGDDRYEATMNSSQGQGHDYSIGLLRDVRGNDRYTCGGGNALGSGHWSGIGIFWDSAGDDHYQARPGCMGNALRPMKGVNCMGLFLDEGGVNVFPPKHPAKPKSVWIRPKVKGRPHCHGLGMSK